MVASANPGSYSGWEEKIEHQIQYQHIQNHPARQTILNFNRTADAIPLLTSDVSKSPSVTN